MKPLIRFFILILFSPLAAVAEEPVSVLRFSNGDSLTGTLHSLSSEQITWHSSLLEEPASFFLKNLLDLTLDPETSEQQSSHQAVVRLTNGDSVCGQLAAVNEHSVELDTWYAGRLTLNRLMISSIHLSELPRYLYQGPTSIDDWKNLEDPPAWSYRNMSLQSKSIGTISQKMDLPDECRFAFEVSWKGRLNLDLGLFIDTLEKQSPRGGYMIKLQQRSITLRNARSQKLIGQTMNAVSLQENEKARIEIQASRKSGKVCLIVDGRPIEVWTDADVIDAAFGSEIRFTNAGKSQVSISQFRVSPWDGEVETIAQGADAAPAEFLDDVAPETQTTKGKEKIVPGRMELRNGDSMVGEVMSIDQGIIVLRTPFREVRLPIESLKNLWLKPVELERSKRRIGDVRVAFPDGTSLVFRLDQIQQEQVKAYSQNFGTATFQLKAFSRIEFHIYDRDFEKIRTEASF